MKIEANFANAKPNLTIRPRRTASGAQIFRASERQPGSGWTGRYSRSGGSGWKDMLLGDIDRTAVGLDLGGRKDAVDVDGRLVVAAVGARVATDRDVGGATRLLVEHHVASRFHGVVQADPQLGDHVRTCAGSLDQVAEHVRGAAALDRGDASALEAERDGLVDQSLDRVRNGQVGDEDAVRAV